MRLEEALEKLEETVKKLEEGNLPLEESLKIFEEGVRLVRFCREKILEVEKRVEILKRDEKGKWVKEPFSVERHE